MITLASWGMILLEEWTKYLLQYLLFSYEIAMLAKRTHLVLSIIRSCVQWPVCCPPLLKIMLLHTQADVQRDMEVPIMKKYIETIKLTLRFVITFLEDFWKLVKMPMWWQSRNYGQDCLTLVHLECILYKNHNLGLSEYSIIECLHSIDLFPPIYGHHRKSLWLFAMILVMLTVKFQIVSKIWE